MIGEVCPKCGANIYPDCNEPDCKGRWCYRAQCGWENEYSCSKLDAELAQVESEVSDTALVSQ